MDGGVARVPPDLVSALELEIVREWSPTRALERLELDGDFALVVCEEVVGGTSGLDLLNAVRAISPTTSRLLISDRFSRSTPKEAAEIVFRCVSPHAPASELRDALRDALQYHQLLATCSAQPVEAARGERAAMRPPAKPEAGRPRAPRWHELSGAAGDVSEAVLADGPAASDPRRAPSVSRVGLSVVGRTVELLPGLTVIGRSRTCHVPIPDPRVSRRHATFSNTGREVLLRNVSSTSGVRVNGVLIERDVDWVVNVGDRVTVGSNEIEVCALGDYYPSHEPTQGGGEAARATRSAAQLSTLVTLARVAEKYFQLGHVREAERISRPVLEGLLRHSESGRTPEPGDVELATGLTLRLAEANGAGEWLDYLFSLFTALERPMPADVIDCLYRVIPVTYGMRIGCFRAYLSMLGSVEDRLGPSARFLIRRIQGLETAIMMSAHV
ncbi:MAG TPA: FHA domain-containing protein [Polyangiaceae bacterium]|nr:FHA domain-containing protein [Polyangiaceae bacterium]